MTDAARLREIAREYGEELPIEAYDDLRSIADRLEKPRWTGRAAAYAKALGLDKREPFTKAMKDLKSCACDTEPCPWCGRFVPARIETAIRKVCEEMTVRLGPGGSFRRRGVPKDVRDRVAWWLATLDRAMKEAERE